jgi:hypothetical protein
MRIRHTFIPMAQAQAGMVLSQPTQVTERGFLSMTLPAGHILTDENLSQLNAHHAEFLYIDRPDSRSDEQVAEDVATAVGRSLAIFDGADLTDPHMAAFFDQVLAYRSA